MKSIRLVRLFRTSPCALRGADSSELFFTPQRRDRRREKDQWLFALLLLFSLSCFGCRRGMYDQPKSRPMRESTFFADGSESRAIPPHTVAQGLLNEDDAFVTGRNGTNLLETFPAPVTSEMLARGRERFDIVCANCHGRTGEGNGMIVQRGFPAPPSYHIDRLRQAPVGHFVDVITRGYGVMYSQAPRVEPADRWAITAYIRALQLSRHATVSDVPAEDRTKLQARQ
jgi:mono/diheme cytochrome c family protein